MTTGVNIKKTDLPFRDFIAYLIRLGFIIGVDQHLRLQILLNKLGRKCKFEDLKFLLCPIFATSEKQQKQFYSAFDAYFKFLELPVKKVSPQGVSKKRETDETQEHPLKARKWPYILSGILLVIMIAAFIYWLKFHPSPGYGEAAQKGIIVNILKSIPPGPGSDRKPEPGHTPETTIDDMMKWVEQIDGLNKLGLIDKSTVEPTFYQRYGPIFQWVGTLSPIIFFLLLFIYKKNRQRLVLEKKRGKKPPFVWPIKIETPVNIVVKNERFYEAARLLRQRLKSDVSRIDMDKTISSTIEKAGFPTFQYKMVTRPPEYLILIDLPAFRDHYAHLIDTITKTLESEGLFVQRYFYEEDPRVCFKSPDGERVYLSDFKTRYSDHRLIVFGDGETLLDPVYWKLDKWTEIFHEWRERAILTPVRPGNWGIREVSLAGEFIVLPASLDGFAALKTHFEKEVTQDLKSWKQDDLKSIILPPEYENNIDSLQTYLGEDTFQWLCACAVYPELHWDLTLSLGTLSCMPVNLIREENLLRLIRLPWFRTGIMPDELRWELINRLTPGKNRAIRSAIVDLLEKNPAPRDSSAYDTYRLHLVVQRWMLSRKNRQRRKEMIDELGAVNEKHVIQDYTLLRFLESAPKSPLSFILPKRLRKTVFRKGVPLFGLKTGIRMVLTVLISLALFLVLKPQPLKTFESIDIIDIDRGTKYPELVPLKDGIFSMGATWQEMGSKPSEMPKHKVTISPFAIGRYEVTNTQFVEFLNEKGNRAESGGYWLSIDPNFTKIKEVSKGKYVVEKGCENYPVVGAGWYGARAYCQWLKKKTGIPFRLPTEAEWEYACRAGTTTPYSFNDINGFERYGYYQSNSNDEPREVGQKLPNQWGLFDMHGNMWEWCLDGWSENYKNAPRDGSAFNFVGNNIRVARGGSWFDPLMDARSANRQSFPAFSKDNRKVGFRVVASWKDGLAPPIPKPPAKETAPLIIRCKKALSLGNSDQSLQEVMVVIGIIEKNESLYLKSGSYAEMRIYYEQLNIKLADFYFKKEDFNSALNYYIKADKYSKSRYTGIIEICRKYIKVKEMTEK